MKRPEPRCYSRLYTNGIECGSASDVRFGMCAACREKMRAATAPKSCPICHKPIAQFYSRCPNGCAS